MIDDAETKKFCNEKIRRMADWIVSLNNFTVGCLANMPAALTNSADTVIDGSTLDGRAPITGAQVYTLLNNLNAFFTVAKGNGNYAIIASVAVNPASPDFTDPNQE